MFIISLIVCIIFNVIVVEPIHGADSSLHKLTKKGQAEDISQIDNSQRVYSDSFTHENNATTQSDPNPKGMASKGIADKSKHYRGVTKTNDAPSYASSASSGSSTKITAQSNDAATTINVTNANTNLPATTSHNATLLLDKNVIAKLKAINIAKPNTVSDTLTISTSTTTTTTTTTTTPKSTTTKTTTTSAPKKPLITFAVEDIPGLLSKAAELQPQLSIKDSSMEEVGNDEPLSLQSSETITYPNEKSNPNFIMAMIGIIFVIPLIIVITNCAVRKVRDVWSKRRYRRMDYLIEDMYN